ncbi:MAG: FeoB small GTPase domain-containing protein, partial [Longicatena sp.]
MLFEKLIAENDKINACYKQESTGYTIALLGNPNVGKSTVFNAMTGMNQHTGNWPGKTVELANGYFTHKSMRHKMVDLPGTYSLLAHSSEEEVTRNFICFEKCDVCMVVCDSTCLERNLNLVLQTLEISHQVIVILNLMDEAEKKNITIDDKRLQEILHVEVVKMSARNEKDFNELKNAIEQVGKSVVGYQEAIVTYPEILEHALQKLEDIIECEQLSPRFVALKLLDPNVDSKTFYEKIKNPEEVKELCNVLLKQLDNEGILSNYEEIVVRAIHNKAKDISNECIIFNNDRYQERDLKIDRILT